jgi:hypothetical protein
MPISKSFLFGRGLGMGATASECAGMRGGSLLLKRLYGFYYAEGD